MPTNQSENTRQSDKTLASSANILNVYSNVKCIRAYFEPAGRKFSKRLTSDMISVVKIKQQQQQQQQNKTKQNKQEDKIIEIVTCQTRNAFHPNDGKSET